LEVEDIDFDKLLDVNSVICVEKEIAADTIGTLFSATGSHFLPYVEECTLELVGQLSHYYDGIRKAALESLLEIVRTMYELSNPKQWEAGMAVVSLIQTTDLQLLMVTVPQKIPLEQPVQGLIGHVLPPLFELFDSEDNK
jgi:importin-4